MWMLDLQLGMVRAWTEATQTWCNTCAETALAATRALTSPKVPAVTWPFLPMQPFASALPSPFQAFNWMPTAATAPFTQVTQSFGIPGWPAASWTWQPPASFATPPWFLAAAWPMPMARPAPALPNMTALFEPFLKLSTAWMAAMTSVSASALKPKSEAAPARRSEPASSYRSAGGHASTAVIVTPYDVARSMSAFWSLDPAGTRGKPH